MKTTSRVTPKTTPKTTPTATSKTATLAAVITALGCAPAVAADWSDTYIGFRTGNKYAEPFGRNDIHKNVFNLTHVSGYKYGTNFFNVDYLMSDDKDPAFAGADSGAREIYVVYRNTLDAEKVLGRPFKFGLIKGWGLTAGVDVNTKNDAGYNSKKQMLLLGPTVFLDVPGFLSVSVLALRESNAPYNTFSGTGVSRYTYKTHPMLTAAWGIPLGAGFSFEGFFNWIAAKGTNEFGGGTSAETNFDGQIMYDVGALYGNKGQFKIGLEYQYWRNKFGNPTTAVGAGAGPGATAKTPMIRAEYHF